jgi:PAS domain-containing protein
LARTNRSPAEELVRLEPAVVHTDLAGFILDANAAAARLLNIGRHGIRPRRFLWFFLHARDAILAAQRAAAMGDTCTVATTLRPADRRSVVVSVIVTRTEDGLRWTVLH